MVRSTRRLAVTLLLAAAGVALASCHIQTTARFADANKGDIGAVMTAPSSTTFPATTLVDQRNDKQLRFISGRAEAFGHLICLTTEVSGVTDGGSKLMTWSAFRSGVPELNLTDSIGPDAAVWVEVVVVPSGWVVAGFDQQTSIAYAFKRGGAPGNGLPAFWAALPDRSTDKPLDPATFGDPKCADRGAAHG